MEPGELERLRAYYAGLSDEELVRAHSFGPAGFREPAIWDVVAVEYARRTAAGGLQDFATPESEAVARQDEPPLKGVAGWLLVLCVSLTILGPARSLHGLYTAFHQWGTLPQIAGLGAVALVDTLVVVALTGLSIYAGIGLWTLRPHAVQTAKRFLWCFAGYQAAAPMVAAILWLPADEEVIFQIALETIPGLVYFAVWYSYLGASKRVRATYES